MAGSFLTIFFLTSQSVSPLRELSEICLPRLDLSSPVVFRYYGAIYTQPFVPRFQNYLKPNYSEILIEKKNSRLRIQTAV